MCLPCFCESSQSFGCRPLHWTCFQTCITLLSAAALCQHPIFIQQSGPIELSWLTELLISYGWCPYRKAILSGLEKAMLLGGDKFHTSILKRFKKQKYNFQIITTWNISSFFPLLGFAFIQHPSLMFEQEVKTLYNSILSDKNCSVNLKIQVLKNLQTYLQEEDTRMQQADRDCKC